MSEQLEIQVRLAPYLGVQIPKREVVVTQEEIASELERARTYASTTKDKSEGSAVMGDQVVIDFIGYINGEAFPGGDGTNYPLVLGSNTFIPGFEEQLVGARIGDVVEVRVPFPENYHAAEYAGKDALFKVTLKGLRETVLPELTDEIVRRISPSCTTVAEFRDYVESEILKYKEKELKNWKEETVLAAVVEQSEIVIPEELINQRAYAIENNILSQLRNAGNELEDYLDYNNLTPEMFHEYARNDARRMLKGQAVLGRIAALEGLMYTEDKLNEELFIMAREYGVNIEEMRQMLGETGLTMVQDDILHQLALDFIVAKSVEI